MMPTGLPFRERTLVLSGLFLITTLSWAYLWRLARDPLAMCMVNMKPWSAADLSALFAMWAVMMVGMMVPSAFPMILAFAGVSRSRRAKSLSYVSTSTFVLGYVAAWTGFGIAATVTQELLHGAALVSSMGIGTSRVFGGLVLMATGTFQWTPLKNACLRHCRSPIGFLLTEWRDGSRGVPDGPASRCILHRLLLASDGASLHRRRDEPLVGRGHHRVRTSRKSCPVKILSQLSNRDQVE